MDGAALTIYLIFSAAIAVITLISAWMIFEKAGEAGWKSLIPFYNTWVLTQFTGAGALWFILMFVPFVNFIALVVVVMKLAESFGKSAGFGIGLLLLSFIFFPILAFGDAQYQGAKA